MSRRHAVVDRLVAALIGLVLLAGGAAAAVWALDVIPEFSSDRASLTGADDLAEAAWWPWALLIGGVVVALLTLLWFLGRLRRDSLRAVSLEGSGPEGRLRLRLDAVASAAASSAQERIAIESASGSTGHGPEAGLIEVSVKARHDASLDEIRRDLSQVDTEVATATSGAVPVRYRVTVARPPRDAATG